MKWKHLVMFIFIMLVTAGCNDAIVQKAEEMEPLDESIEEEQKELDESENLEIEQPSDSDVEFAVQNNEFEKRHVIDNTPAEQKEEYKDPEEFAKFASRILFDFQNDNLDAEEYYNFLINYGSDNAVENLPEAKDNAIAVLESLQNLFIDNEMGGDEYIITNVGYSKGKSEGYFYRMIKNGTIESYYITTIVRKNGIWRFHEDSPSPPFDLEEVNILDKKETDNDELY